MTFSPAPCKGRTTIWFNFISYKFTKFAQSTPTHKADRPTHKADRPTHKAGRPTHTRQTDRHTCTHKADRPTHMHTTGLVRLVKLSGNNGMSGNCLEFWMFSKFCLDIWWKYYTTLYFIKNTKGSMNPVWLSLFFTFHFALFFSTTWKRCDVNPYPWDWKVPWLNGCLMV